MYCVRSQIVSVTVVKMENMRKYSEKNSEKKKKNGTLTDAKICTAQTHLAMYAPQDELPLSEPKFKGNRPPS